MNNRNKRRQDNYLKLRQAGFPSKKATIIKDRSTELVEEVCKIAKECDKMIDFVLERGKYAENKTN